MTPENQRVAKRSVAERYPAIDRLRKTLCTSNKAVLDKYLEWRALPFTRAFTAALAEFADAPYPGVDGRGTEGLLVQSGITIGLNLAYKLFTQPGRVIVGAFNSKAVEPVEVGFDAAYVDTADDVIAEDLLPKKE